MLIIIIYTIDKINQIYNIMIKNDYDFLFKFILVGDTSTPFAISRCGKILYAHASIGKPI